MTISAVPKVLLGFGNGTEVLEHHDESPLVITGSGSSKGIVQPGTDDDWANYEIVLLAVLVYAAGMIGLALGISFWYKISFIRKRSSPPEDMRMERADADIHPRLADIINNNNFY